MGHRRALQGEQGLGSTFIIFCMIPTEAMCESGGQIRQVGRYCGLIWTQNSLGHTALALGSCAQHTFRVTHQCAWHRVSTFLLPLKCGPVISFLCQAICPGLWRPHYVPWTVAHWGILWVSSLLKALRRFLLSVPQVLWEHQLSPLFGPDRTHWQYDPRFWDMSRRLFVSLLLSDDPSSFEWVNSRCLSLSRGHTAEGFLAKNEGGEKEKQCHLLKINLCYLFTLGQCLISLF